MTWCVTRSAFQDWTFHSSNLQECWQQTSLSWPLPENCTQPKRTTLPKSVLSHLDDKHQTTKQWEERRVLLSPIRTTLKGHEAPELSFSIGCSLCYSCMQPNFSLHPVLLPSLPYCCWSLECSLLTAFQANLSFRVCFPGPWACTAG